MSDEFDSKLRRRRLIMREFTPSAPILDRGKFAGREAQIIALVDAVNEPGRHAVLYGERGVGKTSLANIITEVLVRTGDEERDVTVRINCSAADSFDSIWRRVFDELRRPYPDEWSYETPNPDDIRRLLESFSPPYLIVMDEYDRVEDTSALVLMADTIKALSDRRVQTKLVLVGVADSIESLVGAHESVRRAIAQVPVGRMTVQELVRLVRGGLQAAEMDISEGALLRITRLTEGLPTYAHLLTQQAGLRAIEDDAVEVGLAHVEAAIPLVLDTHSTRSVYLGATKSAKSNNLYRQVLLACALAKKDALGYFTAAMVREPMSRIMGRSYDIPAFSKHLASFLENARGAVLVRDGSPRNYRFRFRDPLLQPFVLLSSLNAGLIPEDYLEEMFRQDLEIDWDKGLRGLLENGR